jgi:hypothetical protein
VPLVGTLGRKSTEPFRALGVCNWVGNHQSAKVNALRDEHLIGVLGSALASKNYCVVNLLDPCRTSWTDQRAHCATVLRYLNNQAGYYDTDIDKCVAEFFDNLGRAENPFGTTYAMNWYLQDVWNRAFFEQDVALMRVVHEHAPSCFFLHDLGFIDLFLEQLAWARQENRPEDAEALLCNGHWFLNLDFIPQDVLDFCSRLVIHAVTTGDKGLALMLAHHPKFDKRQVESAGIQEALETALQASTMGVAVVEELRDRLLGGEL